MSKEIWKDIPDYEGLYQASSLGRIRSLARIVPNGKKSVMLKHGRILKQDMVQSNKNPNRKNARVTLKKGNQHKTSFVSRLVASAFYGKSNLTVNHINGNPLDNRAINLEWCSLEENIRKGFENGLYDKKFKGVRIVEKTTGTVFVFENCSSASRYFGMSQSYWFRPKKETKKFKWELL